MRSPEIPFPALLQDFFLSRLIEQRGVSARTVESYRDAFEMLLTYAEERTGKQPSKLSLADLDAPLILGFLDFLETERGNCPRSRNARLSAIRSFMKYASVRDPSSLPIVQQVLAIPPKRFDQPVLGFLTRAEMEAILDAPDRATWSGQRDAVLFATLYNTGARVSELIGLRACNVLLNRETSVHLHGKGRKERVLPLWKSTAKALRAWLAKERIGPDSPVFPNRYGAALTRSGVRDRLKCAATRAEEGCPSLRGRRISPHTIRHSTGMHLYQAGVDVTTIALWLGHANPSTTHIYLEADLAMKEAALKRVADPSPRPARFRAKERLLAFLEAL
ncbi:MAG: integrase [Acidobacteria bacterium]|nr:MAG: integrase [Acidobacteriota bacterium]